MNVLETGRLDLRQFGPEDAGFILRLVTDPSWRRYIGDRGVCTLEDAARYIDEKLVDQYRRFGFGLYCVVRRTDGCPLGMCGLVKRDTLADVDLGFAFLPEHRGRGYALESASAVIAWARQTLGLGRLVAITSPDNQAAQRLLARLGFRAAGNVRPAPDDTGLRLFELAATGDPPAGNRPLPGTRPQNPPTS